MNYIILDLEWNQPSCTPGDMPVNGIPFEIIEIGAVKLNDKKEYLDCFHRVIAPVIYTQLHQITSELTSITADELSGGDNFPAAFNDFIKWCGSDYIFCTWGAMDITELQRNMKHYNIPLLPFPVYYYDLQKIFSIIYEDGKLRRSLEYAVEYLQLDASRPFHRAIDDARYTADVLSLLDDEQLHRYYSIDTYQLPDSKKTEIYACYDTYSKYISRSFDDKVMVMDDKTVTSTPCYRCGRKLKKKVRWFSGNSRIYYCLCICPEHGYLKGKIRMKKNDDGKYYAIRTLKLTDEAGADKIYARQADIRRRRRERRHLAKNSKGI